LVDDPVARGARTAPAPPTSRSSPHQRRPLQRARGSLELHPARAPAVDPNRKSRKRISEKELAKKYAAAGAAGAAAVGRRRGASRAREGFQRREVNAARLYAAAKEGQINEVSYKFAKPGPDKTPVDKVSFVTAVADLGCGVGYYK
jgi:hypothetical protein